MSCTTTANTTAYTTGATDPLGISTRLTYRAYGEKEHNMTTTTAPTRYTINRDGTLEKWYLEHDGGETVYLRKTPRPKWNCSMKEFPAAEVYETYRAARNAQKGHL